MLAVFPVSLPTRATTRIDNSVGHDPTDPTADSNSIPAEPVDAPRFAGQGQQEPVRSHIGVPRYPCQYGVPVAGTGANDCVLRSVTDAYRAGEARRIVNEILRTLTERSPNRSGVTPHLSIPRAAGRFIDCKVGNTVTSRSCRTYDLTVFRSGMHSCGSFGLPSRSARRHHNQAHHSHCREKEHDSPTTTGNRGLHATPRHWPAATTA